MFVHRCLLSRGQLQRPKVEREPQYRTQLEIRPIPTWRNTPSSAARRISPLISHPAGRNIVSGWKIPRTRLEETSDLAGTPPRTRLEETSHPVGTNIAPGWKRIAPKQFISRMLQAATGVTDSSQFAVLIVFLAINNSGSANLHGHKQIE